MLAHGCSSPQHAQTQQPADFSKVGRTGCVHQQASPDEEVLWEAGNTGALQWLTSLHSQLRQQEPPKQLTKQFADDGSAAQAAPASPALSPMIQMALAALLSHPLPSIKVRYRQHGRL